MQPILPVLQTDKVQRDTSFSKEGSDAGRGSKDFSTELTSAQASDDAEPVDLDTNGDSGSGAREQDGNTDPQQVAVHVSEDRNLRHDGSSGVAVPKVEATIQPSPLFSEEITQSPDEVGPADVDFPQTNRTVLAESGVEAVDLVITGTVGSMPVLTSSNLATPTQSDATVASGLDLAEDVIVPEALRAKMAAPPSGTNVNDAQSGISANAIPKVPPGAMVEKAIVLQQLISESSPSEEPTELLDEVDGRVLQASSELRATTQTAGDKLLQLHDQSQMIVNMRANVAHSNPEAHEAPRFEEFGILTEDLEVAAVAETLGNARGVSVSPVPTGRVDSAQSIASQMATVVQKNGVGQYEIALNPPELGRVRIQLDAVDGGFIVSIQSDRPETMDLMRRHIDQLEKQFVELGYENLDFNFGSGGGRQEDDNASTSDVSQSAGGLDAPEAESGSKWLIQDGKMDIRL